MYLRLEPLEKLRTAEVTETLNDPHKFIPNNQLQFNNIFINLP